MPRFAANLTMLFTELPFLDRFGAARRAGFTGVEYLFPYAFPAADLAGELAENGLTQVLHNLPAGDWDAGERGIACRPDRVSEFREGVGRAIEYARTLGCQQVNCLVGLTPQDVPAGQVRDTLVANLAYAADALKRASIRLLVEPVNTRDIPGFHLSRTRQALDLIAAVGSDNLFLQYDIYHAQVMEGDLARTIAENLSLIAHVQVADNPGRHEPGTGEINFPYLFEHLDALGYRGWIGCEYRPRGATASGLHWLPSRRRAA
ncbi:hydroxypyruvate isomerase [Methylobacterium sp. A54F]